MNTISGRSCWNGNIEKLILDEMIRRHKTRAAVCSGRMFRSHVTVTHAPSVEHQPWYVISDDPFNLDWTRRCWWCSWWRRRGADTLSVWNMTFEWPCLQIGQDRVPQPLPCLQVGWDPIPGKPHSAAVHVGITFLDRNHCVQVRIMLEKEDLNNISLYFRKAWETQDTKVEQTWSSNKFYIKFIIRSM